VKFKKILVTGGAGFIGSNFIRHLLRRTKGEGRRALRVTNLDKLTYSGNLENLKDVEKNPRYKFVRGDICDSKLVNRLTRGCDAIINFAAESHVDRSIKNSFEFTRTNVFGTQVLLDAAKKNRVKRVLHISTDEVYGSTKKGSFTEDSPLRPNSPYAATKASADLMVRSYSVTHTVPAVIVRSSNNFGPFQFPEKVMPLFITNAMENKKLPLYADGSNVREWLYVIDNCDAIACLLEKGKDGEIYNIGSGNELKNIDLTKRILRIMGKGAGLIKFVKDRPGHDRRYSLDIKKLSRLGWKPRHKFEDALRETVLWYKENKRWWKRLKTKEEKFW